MTVSPFRNQIQNRNFLSPTGFQFSLSKEPKVSFFCTSARIPELSLQTTVQPSYLKDIDVPGEKITYGDLTIQFLVDENMENYKTVYDWIVGLGFPETTQQYKDFLSDPKDVTQPGDEKEQFADGTLRILNSTSTDINYFTAQATFKYTVYQLTSST